MQAGMSLLLLLFLKIHYFHNDCHYAQALSEFHFANQVCGQRNNYHLCDVKNLD